MGLRQFIDEARRHSRLPEAMQAPVRGEINLRVAARARDADVSEAAFLLEPGAAALVERALIGEQAVLPAGQEYRVEFETLRAVQSHQGHAVLILAGAGFHDQGNMLEEGAHVGKFLHRAYKLLEIVEPAGGIGRTIRLPHVGVAGLLEDLRRDLGVWRAALE